MAVCYNTNSQVADLMNAANRHLHPLEREESPLSLVPRPTPYPDSLPLDAIQLPPSQPRRYFDPTALQNLTQSIAQYGILEPLLVRPIESNRYELVAGERRYRAAQQAGLTEVPVTVRALSDRDALRIALLENLQREDLNPIEETEGMLQLLSIELQQPAEAIPALLHRLRHEAKGKTIAREKNSHNVMGTDEGAIVRSVFESIGTMTWESFVSNRLPLLKLPESILKALRQGQLAYTKALAIAKVHQTDQRDCLLAEAIAENLSLSEIRSRVSSLNAPSSTHQSPSISLRHRWSHVYQRLQQSGVLNHPLKRQQVEALVAQLMAIAESNDPQSEKPSQDF